MVDLKERLTGLVRTLPPAQRAGLVVAAIVLVLAAIPFIRWVASPNYTLLYSGLEDRELAQVTSELDEQGVTYQLDGNRVMVPQDQVHQTRANLAEAGLSGSPTIPGYELLDEQALGVSDFRQRVDLQRAVEGELARTLTAMDAIETATVRLVIPEDSLFTEQRNEPTASVLIRPVGQIDRHQVEAITMLVSSAVEGLDVDQVTVADTNGQVLHAPGDGGAGGVTDRQQQRTRDFEQALAGEITQLLQRATDAPASVVVRATLDFNELETQTETFEDGGVPLREQTTSETYEGVGPAIGGIVGVDGGPLPEGGGEGQYARDDENREFGVGRTVTRLVQAPGTVEQLSVAIVVDEGAAVGDGELQQLVAAAAGTDPARGDEIAITRVATPPPPPQVVEGDGPGLVDLIQQIVALLVLVIIAVALFLMSRKRAKAKPPIPERVVPAQVRPQPQVPDTTPEEIETTPSVQDEVVELVERQPEEIATLLRSWLADRRGAGV